MQPIRIAAVLTSLSLLVNTMLALAQPLPPASAEPAALSLVVTTTLADAVDANPGDGVCETAPGNGVCTLRAAVREANAYPGADSIYIPAGTYYLGLPATSHENAALNGDLDLTDSVTITGAGQAATIIDGNHTATNARVFEILAGATVTMTHLTVRNGTNEPGQGIDGGIINAGTVSLAYVTLTGNIRGGFDNYGTAILDHVTYTENTGNSGGLFNNGVLTITNSVIANNENNGNGGGLTAGLGQTTLINTTISGNRTTNGSNSGGGILVYNGILTAINSTISGNRASGHGGGLYVGQFNDSFTTAVNLHNVTIADNIADANLNGFTGGGVHVSTASGSIPVVNLYNTLIANNRRRTIIAEADDCNGPVVSAGYNLLETSAGCTISGVTTGLVTGTDPALEPLADNGGATQTHALGGNSLAIDGGNPAGCADALGVLLATDQRGLPRIRGARCDLGALEAWIPSSFVYIPFVTR